MAIDKEFTSRDNLAVDEQIRNEQKTVSYDTKEYTVEILVKKFDDGDLFVPDYQRKYVWDEPRKRKFLESVLLGLPIPFMFCADTRDGKLEIIDGVQRLTTLHSFINDQIMLQGLGKLTTLKGQKFKDLPISQQRKFLNRTLRMVVLQESADDQVRFDIFERINTGSDSLTKRELRKGAYQGKFYDFVAEMARIELFRTLCPIGKMENRGEAEELVLRFFAYSEKYLKFDHSVHQFLNDFLKEKNLKGFDYNKLKKEFTDMLNFVAENMPNGFRKTPKAKTTPRVRFEAIAVGVNLALRAKPTLKEINANWLATTEFRKYTTSDASNSKPKLKARIEYVRDAILAQS
jgi:hypothetical protein